MQLDWIILLWKYVVKVMTVYLVTQSIPFVSSKPIPVKELIDNPIVCNCWNISINDDPFDDSFSLMINIKQSFVFLWELYKELCINLLVSWILTLVNVFSKHWGQMVYGKKHENLKDVKNHINFLIISELFWMFQIQL